MRFEDGRRMKFASRALTRSVLHSVSGSPAPMRVTMLTRSGTARLGRFRSIALLSSGCRLTGVRYFENYDLSIGGKGTVYLSRRSAGVITGFEPQVKCRVV